jgi:hypothetical protein
MVLCALVGLSASLRCSGAKLPASAHKTSVLLLTTQYTISRFVTTVKFKNNNVKVNSKN